MKKEKLLNLLNNWKTKHESPNTELYDYNRGYVRAMNDVINELNSSSDSKSGPDVWYGPDVVPPTKTKFVRVEGDDGYIYRYSREKYAWMKYVVDAEDINEMWVESTPNRWRYPAPVKI